METFITVKKGWFKKRVGLRFDMGAYFYLMELHGIDINDTAIKDPEEFMVGLIHCAAIRFYETHTKKIWFDREKVEGWIPFIQYGEMEQLKKVMNSSALTIQETAKQMKSSGTKKKS